MAFGAGWDSEKMLDQYIYDYMVRRKMGAAEIFAREANVFTNDPVVDMPNGFLSEWWMIFLEVYFSRLQTRCEPMEGSSPTQMMENEEQSNCPAMPKVDMNPHMLAQFPTSTGFDGMLGQPASSLLISNRYVEERSRLPPKDLSPNLRIDVDKLFHSKSSSSYASYSLQQIPKKTPQWTDTSCAVSFGGTSRMDSNPYGVPKATFPGAGLHVAGMEKEANSMPLKGWPLTEVDQIFPGMALPKLNSQLPIPNQQQLFPKSMPSHQLSTQVLEKSPGKQISSPQECSYNFSNLMLLRNDLTATDSRMTVPGKQMPEQEMMDPLRQMVEQETMVPTKETAEKEENDKLMRQESCDQNSRRRKGRSNSHAKENSLDVMDIEVDKSADSTIDLLLSQNAEIDEVVISFSNIKQGSPNSNVMGQQGFSFAEVGSLSSGNGKVLCCHFSSDGKLLASAGHDKEVLLLNTTSFELLDAAEGHLQATTDVRFRPNSTIFATSSLDRSVQIWDSNKPRKSLSKLSGHAEQVNSLDFHPRKLDLLCSCDSNDEIRLWNVNQYTCIHVLKGATRKVRFQPQVGDLLAAASGNRINLFDVGTNNLQSYLEGHDKEVRSICWDATGKYIASVSEDCARVWSVGLGGKCVHELHSNGKGFESCTFHPAYSQLLIIGSSQTLDFWNPTEGKNRFSFVAHKGLIAALADCPTTEMVASASHDHIVKVWK